MTLTPIPLGGERFYGGIVQIEIVQPNQHFGELDRCRCGAYRYIMLRETKKNIDIQLIHQDRGKVPNRRYRTVARISKFLLDIHADSNLVLGTPDEFLNLLIVSKENLGRLIADYRTRTKVRSSESL